MQFFGERMFIPLMRISRAYIHPSQMYCEIQYVNGNDNDFFCTRLWGLIRKLTSLFFGVLLFELFCALFKYFYIMIIIFYKHIYRVILYIKAWSNEKKTFKILVFTKTEPEILWFSIHFIYYYITSIGCGYIHITLIRSHL